jgi:hypothetical protein
MVGRAFAPVSDWARHLWPPDPESSHPIANEAEVTLLQVLKRPKDKLEYLYDFGDGWHHEVVLEKLLPAEDGGRFPIILAGKRACPPEDVGGLYGYYRLLEVLSDPKHPDHQEMLDWAGGPIDPEEFDIRSANTAIHGGWVME